MMDFTCVYDSSSNLELNPQPYNISKAIRKRYSNLRHVVSFPIRQGNTKVGNTFRFS